MSVNPIYGRVRSDYLSAYPASNYNNLQASVFLNTSQNACSLEAQLESVQNEQGILGKAWNGIKNFFHIGLSSDDVKETIEQYKSGEISYEEAQNTIENFDKKQEGAVNIIANTATGLATAGIAVATGGVGAIAAGAAIGGATKAGLKTLDRATNSVEGDALDIKQIAKDGLTGAVDVAFSTVTAGMIKAPVAGQTVSQAVKIGIIQGAKAGAIAGAVTGASDYTAEAVFEEDVNFTIDGLMASTAQNAIAGGVMGGIMGGVTGGFAQNKLNKAAAGQNVQADSQITETGDTAEVLPKDSTAENLEIKPADADAAASTVPKQPGQISTKLSESDIKNIEIYKNGENYERINRQMREGTVSAKTKATIDAVDKAFETDGIVLDADTVLYRGVRREYSWLDGGSFHSEVYDNLKPGDILTDDAFISTTRNIDVARCPEYMGYADGFNPTERFGYLLEIHAPKGTNVLDIENVLIKNGGKCMALNESELLLPHGTSFVVRDVQGDTIILDILNKQ